MQNSNFQIGQKAIFNYDRNYMVSNRTKSHDGELVTIISNPWQAQGHTYINVENAANGIYPVMIQELTICDNI